MRTRGLKLQFIMFLLALVVFPIPGRAQMQNIAEKLGYPANSKLLIIHGDDLAVAHSVDVATFRALDEKAISSASIMMTCPWVTEVAAYAKAHPDADLGLHLTLTSEWETYKQGVGVIGLRLKYLPVERLGLGQPTGLMQGRCLLQSTLQG